MIIYILISDCACVGIIENSYNLNVEHGKTYLLWIVNAGLHSEYYFKIAGHIFTVVAADANYVKHTPPISS